MSFPSENLPTVPSQLASQITTGAPSEYRSAYSYGITTKPDGSFDHFVCLVDRSHLHLGYWRFSSSADDQLAYNRGFSSPEDVLVAQDRDNGSYDDISLQWVPGENDVNLRDVLVGSPVQHVDTINEIRRMLDMPILLRRQVPVYPTVEDDRLKRFWESKCSANRLLKLYFPNLTTASSQHSNSELLHYYVRKSSRQSGTDDGDLESSWMNQTPPRESGSGTPRAPTISPFTSPEPDDIDAMSETAESPLFEQNSRSKKGKPDAECKAEASTNHDAATSNDVAIQQPQSTAFTTKPQPLASSRSYDDQDMRLLSSNHIIRQYLSKDETPLSRPSSPSACSNLTVPSCNIPSPHALPGLHSFSLAEFDISFSGLPQDVDSSQSPSNPAAQISLDLTTPQQSNEESILLNGQRLACFDQNVIGNIVAAQEVPLGIGMGQNSASTSGNPSHDAVMLEASSNEGQGITTIGQSVVDTDMIVLPDQVHSPLEENNTYPILPCIDCGLEHEHKWDCHIGNLQPMENLTALDYRELADAVERFDPGPWTTHFASYPVQEQEDVVKQIRDMAEAIRNEISYLDDPELHGLSDEVMVILWAFKTASSVRVLDARLE